MFHHISKHHKVRWKHPAAYHIACVENVSVGLGENSENPISQSFFPPEMLATQARIVFQLCSRYLKKWWHMCLIYITPSIQLVVLRFFAVTSGVVVGGGSFL